MTSNINSRQFSLHNPFSTPSAPVTLTCSHSLLFSSPLKKNVSDPFNVQTTQIRTFAKKKKKNKKNIDPPLSPSTPSSANNEENLKDDYMDINDDNHQDDSDEENEDENEDENDIDTLPSIDKTRKRMQSIVDSMEHSLRSLRGAEPTPELFEHIQVNAYGSSVALNTLAQVVISSPSLVVLTCYDPSTSKNVRDSVAQAGLNLNPRIDDPSSGEVQVPIPKISTETRSTLAKELHKMAERYKSRIRDVRKRANDKVKKGKDGKLEGISKDDAFRVGKEIDDLTHEINQKVNEILDEKEKTIMGA